MWLTWANGLTAIRALSALPCAWLIVRGQWGAAAVLVTIAVVSDLLDGPLARRLGQSSALGGVLDHGADAWFVTCLLTGLCFAGLVPWLLPVLVVAAFTQYTIDSRVLHGRGLRGSRLGRINGIGYYLAAALPVYGGAFGVAWPSGTVLVVLSWILIASTLISMAGRLRVVTE
jgi:cardiolipin synthase (CMP-forming)